MEERNKCHEERNKCDIGYMQGSGKVNLLCQYSFFVQ